MKKYMALTALMLSIPFAATAGSVAYEELTVEYKAKALGGGVCGYCTNKASCPFEDLEECTSGDELMYEGDCEACNSHICRDPGDYKECAEKQNDNNDMCTDGDGEKVCIEKHYSSSFDWEPFSDPDGTSYSYGYCTRAWDSDGNATGNYCANHCSED